MALEERCRMEERRRMDMLLKEAIMVLCKNGLSYQSGVTVKGLLGITVDDQHAFFVSLNERIECSSSTPGPTEGSSSTPGWTEGSSSTPGPTEGSSSTPGQTDGSSSTPGQTEGSSSTAGRTDGSSFSPGDVKTSPHTPTIPAASPGRQVGAARGETQEWDAGNLRRTTTVKRRHDHHQHSDSSNNQCESPYNIVTTLSPRQLQDPDQPPAKRPNDDTININDDDDEIQIIKSEYQSDKTGNASDRQEVRPIDDIPLHIKEEDEDVPTDLTKQSDVTAQYNVSSVKQEAYALLFLKAIRDNAMETRPRSNYGNQLLEPSQQYRVSVTMETKPFGNQCNQPQQHYSSVTMVPMKQEHRGLQIVQPASQHLKHTATLPGRTSVQHIIQIKPDNAPPCTDSNRNTSNGNVQYFLSSRAKTSRKLCRLFPCEFCGKMFTTSSGLYFHKPIHTGQWKYKCELCDKCYMETSKYRNHIMVHRKEIQVGLNRKQLQQT